MTEAELERFYVKAFMPIIEAATRRLFAPAMNRPDPLRVTVWLGMIGLSLLVWVVVVTVIITWLWP